MDDRWRHNRKTILHTTIGVSKTTKTLSLLIKRFTSYSLNEQVCSAQYFSLQFIGTPNVCTMDRFLSKLLVNFRLRQAGKDVTASARYPLPR